MTKISNIANICRKEPVVLFKLLNQMEDISTNHTMFLKIDVYATSHNSKVIMFSHGVYYCYVSGENDGFRSAPVLLIYLLPSRAKEVDLTSKNKVLGRKECFVCDWQLRRACGIEGHFIPKISCAFSLNLCI